ncbi:F-box/kelch-repeat protein At3g06240-like [Rutidosis leptorrhynchoides]|uniref:F-box/kelch-repeat protein At3g06240-like n=1 Tax=Rutidosis leptorrhynchoides TaxID=125765 RepID=UPI003A9A28F7
MASKGGIISLPSELITEILYRLPSKSVGRFSSCNGLILLSAFRRGSGYETLVVSNPTTREFVELPVCDFKIEGHRFVSCIRCGLGYHSVTDDYKVVTINRIGADRIMCVHVYSLRRNIRTRVIDFPDKYRMLDITSEAFVNGSFHWLATKVPDQIKVIVAFSLADENFTEVPSPTFSYDLDTFCRLCVVDDKLAIFSVFKGEVWLMNEYGVKGSWTKIKLHGLNEIPMIGLPFVFYVNGKLVHIFLNEMLIYDIEDGRLSKRIDTSGNTHLRDYTYFSCVCVESLVSPRFNRSTHLDIYKFK